MSRPRFSHVPLTSKRRRCRIRADFIPAHAPRFSQRASLPLLSEPSIPPAETPFQSRRCCARVSAILARQMGDIERHSRPSSKSTPHGIAGSALGTLKSNRMMMLNSALLQREKCRFTKPIHPAFSIRKSPAVERCVIKINTQVRETTASPAQTKRRKNLKSH